MKKVVSPSTEEMQKLLEKRPLKRKFPDSGWFDTLEIPRYADNQVWMYYENMKSWLRIFLPKLEAFIRNHPVSREKLRKLIEDFPKPIDGRYTVDELKYKDWKERLEMLLAKKGSE